jgi:hypothetical protein
MALVAKGDAQFTQQRKQKNTKASNGAASGVRKSVKRATGAPLPRIQASRSPLSHERHASGHSNSAAQTSLLGPL